MLLSWILFRNVLGIYTLGMNITKQWSFIINMTGECVLNGKLSSVILNLIPTSYLSQPWIHRPQRKGILNTNKSQCAQQQLMPQLYLKTKNTTSHHKLKKSIWSNAWKCYNIPFTTSLWDVWWYMHVSHNTTVVFQSLYYSK